MHLIRLILPAALLLAAAASAQHRPPNFLVIIADDVTWNDLPLHGGPNIETEIYTGLYPLQQRF